MGPSQIKLAANTKGHETSKLIASSANGSDSMFSFTHKYASQLELGIGYGTVRTWSLKEFSTGGTIFCNA